MNNVLIVGVDTVAGANCAVVLSQRFRIVGLSTRRDIHITGCEIDACPSHDVASIRHQIQQAQPTWIIFAGAAARSTWDFDGSHSIDDAAAIAWATEAKATGASFTMLSSDAVFTGPWISHSEDDDHFCETPRATRLRQVEDGVFKANESSLIVRTNVFGWSPVAACGSFASKVMEGLQCRDINTLDFMRHASPIGATELARQLLLAFDEGVVGLLHLAGGERVNPFSFALRLADACELPRPQIPQTMTLSAPVVGFGLGETTLDCSFARELLGISQPLLEDTIRSLIAERSNGHLARLVGEKTVKKKAA